MFPIPRVITPQTEINIGQFTTRSDCDSSLPPRVSSTLVVMADLPAGSRRIAGALDNSTEPLAR